MSFEEILASVRERAKGADVSEVGFLAVQVTLTDCGVFYIEVKDGRVNIEPYEYIDRNCELVLTPENFCKIMDGSLDAVKAFTVGKLKVNGDLGKALEFSKIIKK